MFPNSIAQTQSFVNRAIYAISNGVIAFSCAGPEANSISYAVYGRMLTDITNACGNYIAGTRQYSDDQARSSVGYMRGKAGDDFCAAAESSSAHSCKH